MAQVECPRCLGKIDPRATRCQHCQVDFTPEDLGVLQKQRSRPQTTTWAVIGGVLVLIIALGQCGAGTSTTANSTAADAALDRQADALEAAADRLTAEGNSASAGSAQTNWVYNRRTDELRKSEIVTAQIRSENEVSFDFPYQGGSGLTLMVRKHPEYGQDVSFTIDKGQFLCGIYDCEGMISVDGRSERLSLGPPSDHDNEVLFAKYGSAIIKKLKGSKKVIVELPFYREGNRQFTFDTAGLEWPPKKEPEVASKTRDVKCDPALAKSVGLSCEE